MKLYLVLAALAIAVSSINADAQLSKKDLKNRKESLEVARELNNQKVSKDVKRRVKEAKKGGWKNGPNAMSLERQFARDEEFQLTPGSDGFTPKFIPGEGTSVGETYDAAKMQALDIAKLGIINQLESDISQITSTSLSNKQLGKDEAVSLAKTVSESKSLMQQKLGRTIVVVEMYRTTPNRNYEVSVRTYYDSEKALSIAKETIREQLEKENNELSKKLENWLNERIP